MSVVVVKSLGGGEVSSGHDPGEFLTCKKTELALEPSAVTSRMSSGVLSAETRGVEGIDLEQCDCDNDKTFTDHSENHPTTLLAVGDIFKKLKQWSLLALVGSLVVSFWRGLWSLFDIYSCGQSADATLLNGQLFCFANDLQNPERRDSALLSLGIGVSLTALGKLLFWNGLFADSYEAKKRLALATRRSLMVQIMAMGGVFTWRGIWMLTETWFYPEDIIKSGWLTATLGFVGCLLLCSSASLAAAPTGLLRDPALETFDTIGSIIQKRHSASNESRSAAVSLTTLADLAGSYIALPIFEVWCWRGIWTLQDYYLWGYTESTADIHWSLWMGGVIFSVSVVSSRVIVVYSKRHQICDMSLLVPHVASRLQNMLLGMASVSFWRVIWYVWEDTTGSGTRSAWVSHLLGGPGLLVLGGYANVTFPPAVDSLWLSSSPSLTENAKEEDPLQWFGIAS